MTKKMYRLSIAALLVSSLGVVIGVVAWRMPRTKPPERTTSIDVRASESGHVGNVAGRDIVHGEEERHENDSNGSLPVEQIRVEANGGTVEQVAGRDIINEVDPRQAVDEAAKKFVTNVVNNGLDSVNGRSILSDVLTALDGGEEASLFIGSALTVDGMAYRVKVRDGKWSYQEVSTEQEANAGFDPGILYRPPDAMSRITVDPFVKLQNPEVVWPTDSKTNVILRVHVSEHERRQVEDLGIVFKTVQKKGGKLTRYDQILKLDLHETPIDVIEMPVDLQRLKDQGSVQSASLSLRGFLLEPSFRYCRISNVVPCELPNFESEEFSDK